MPSKDQINRITGSSPMDLKKVRIPGLSKSFEQLTISELVQLRPGSDVADTYEVNAVTDNVSATTSAALEALGRIHKDRVMNQVIDQSRLNVLRGQLGGSMGGGIARFSSDEPASNEVKMGDSDVFSAGDDDPFKA